MWWSLTYDPRKFTEVNAWLCYNCFDVLSIFDENLSMLTQFLISKYVSLFSRPKPQMEPSTGYSPGQQRETMKPPQYPVQPSSSPSGTVCSILVLQDAEVEFFFLGGGDLDLELKIFCKILQ